jgi:hypothetical protein
MTRGLECFNERVNIWGGMLGGRAVIVDYLNDVRRFQWKVEG